MLSAITAILLLTWLLAIVAPSAIQPFLNGLLVVGIALFIAVSLNLRRALA